MISLDTDISGGLAGSVLHHIREGRIERSLSLIAGFAALISGIEVTQAHYTGSFGQSLMFSPPACCLLLFVVAVWAGFSPIAAHEYLIFASTLLILNGLLGFGFHMRGIARKPGGWRRNLVTNIVMGPPLFAPLLLGISGFLGLVASQTLPEHSAQTLSPAMLEGLRKWLAAVTAISATLNGFEALYSHYKSRFRLKAQWTPIILAPCLFVSALFALFFPGPGRTSLAAISVIAVLAGVIGAGFHLNGICKRPRGKGQYIYNFVYGPPLFAPLLFAASGFLGFLASQIGWMP